MFATLVWKTQLQDALRDAVAPGIIESLNEMRRVSPALAPGRGWQSAPTLHERDEFRGLMACVHHVATGIQRFLRIGCDKLEITGCWATILASGAMHRTHSHPNNFLSGVYYLNVGPGADTISLSFNLMFPAFTETLAKPMW